MGLWNGISLGIRKKHIRIGNKFDCVEGVKGGPEPLEKEINEILGSKREDRLSDPFF
jgi:hypothetical protein